MSLPKFTSADQSVNFMQTQWAAVLDPLIEKINNLFVSKAMTMQIFRSGTGNYNLPVNPSPICLWLREIGGGGGGGGAGTVGPTAGGTGGSTSFGSWVASGGGGGSAGTGSPGSGTGGVAVANLGNPQVTILGAPGGTAVYAANASATPMGGVGGSGYFGGAGQSVSNTTGGSGQPNTGGGAAGGGGNPATSFGGGGGASGSYLEQVIVNPASIYTYVVGAGGLAGNTGNVAAGGAGGSGLIIVFEYYQ